VSDVDARSGKGRHDAGGHVLDALGFTVQDHEPGRCGVPRGGEPVRLGDPREGEGER